jgi:cation:H+ antiporter
LNPTHLALLTAGVVLTWVGAEALVRGSVRLALHWGVSPLIIGLTVVAFGTSSPEAVVSFMASARGVGGIALGNVLGSNIANVGLILGIIACVAPLSITWTRLRENVWVMLSVSVVAALLLWVGWMGRLAGLLFLAAQAGLIAHYVRLARSERRGRAAIHEVVPEVDPQSSQWVSMGLVVAGLGLLILGAQWLVQGAEAIAMALGIPEAVVGATMVAVGTSLPELAASVAAVLRGQEELGLGNVLGSNTMNLLFVLGGSSVISPLSLSHSRDTLVLAVMLGYALLLTLLLRTRPRLGRVEGILLLALYGLFAARVYF